MNFFDDFYEPSRKRLIEAVEEHDVDLAVYLRELVREIIEHDNEEEMLELFALHLTSSGKKLGAYKQLQVNSVSTRDAVHAMVEEMNMHDFTIDSIRKVS